MDVINRTVAHYRLIERIGIGANGEVYKAEDLRLSRTVAMKFVATTDRMAETNQQLIDEARIAAGINHPNVATVYELGEQDGAVYVAMEYLQGQTLAHKLTSELLPLSETIQIATQIAEGLIAAHDRGIIHYDLKPANIMLTDSGVKILDFGLARLAAVVANTQRQTSVIAGTLRYMSPEQLRGELPEPSTDIFSLGLIIYEMITGLPAIEGEDKQSLCQFLLEREPRPLSAFRHDIPLEMENIVRRAIRKERERRYQSVDELLSDLHRVNRRLASEETTARSAEPVTPKSLTATRLRPLQTHRWLLTVAAIITFGTIVDLLIGRPQGTGSARDIAAMIVAAACITIFAFHKNKKRALVISPPTSSDAAFRGLVPFQEADRDRFFGRENDISSLFGRVIHDDFSFGVLYGDSGSGKTSLLRAGLLPRLRDCSYVPIYCRSYRDPIKAMFEECRRQTQIDAHEGESPTEYLRRVSEAMLATVIVIWDQFEEFFVNLKQRQERESFLKVVAACNNDASLSFKILLSMRSDFLHLILSEFAEYVSEPLSTSRIYHLRQFDEHQATEIIDRSAAAANLPLDPELSQAVARDLAVGDAILPSELQTVGERLQSKRIFTVQAYKRAGGKEQLVHGFLDYVIGACGDADGAKLLLRSLISDESTKLTLSLSEIAHRMQRSEAVVRRLLGVFVQSHLVREIQDDEPWRYELMHEYLIEKINQITGRVMDATQRANRLLRQYSSSYSADRRTRIPVISVFFIRRYSDIKRAERERELLSKSLRWGLTKSIAIALLLVVGTTVAAAGLSISEEWETSRLSDGHTAAVRQVVFSPDGKLLVSGGEDSKIIVWDFAKRQRLATLTDHTGWVNSLSFAANGKWFASSSEDHTVIVWDAVSFKKLITLRVDQYQLRAVAFSHDGRFLASSGVNNKLLKTVVWSTDNWQQIYEMPKGLPWGCLLFTPDDRYLMVSAGLYTFDMSTGRQVEHYFGAEWGGSGSAMSPDGTRLVAVEGTGTVSFLDITNHRLINKQRVHRFHGRSAAYSPDGRLAATSADDIVLWDAGTQKKLLRLEHPAEVWGLAFSPDGRWLVSSHVDGAILLWDLSEGTAVANLSAHQASVRAVAFSPDGKRIASASEDRSVIIWNTETGVKEAVMTEHETRVTAVAFSPNGKFIASTDQESRMVYWDIEKRAVAWKKESDDNEMYGTSYCIVISPDGKYIASTSGVFESADGRRVVDFFKAAQNSGDQNYGVAFSPDGKLLAAAAPVQQWISVWDTNTWQLRYRVKLDGAFLNSASFSPDGKYLATGEDQGNIRLWQADPLREIAIIGHHSGRVKSVAFSPDGRQIASAGEDQTIALWDVNNRKLVTLIGSHVSPVLAIAFSKDGKRLASGEHDNSVRIYTRHRTLWGHRLD